MKLPESEQRAYEHYKDDLHYQASMFESSFGDGYKEGEAKAIRQMVQNMVKENISKKIIMTGTGLTEAEIKFILDKNDKKNQISIQLALWVYLMD